jgi:hypothetical protein
LKSFLKKFSYPIGSKTGRPTTVPRPAAKQTTPFEGS